MWERKEKRELGQFLMQCERNVWRKVKPRNETNKDRGVRMIEKTLKRKTMKEKNNEAKNKKEDYL